MTTLTLNDAIQKVSETEANIKRLDRSSAQIGYENGYLLDSKTGNEIALDTRGFTRLCDVLSIPKAFARRVPPDLADDIFERLLADTAPSYSLIVQGETLVGFSNPEYPNVGAEQLLEPIVAMFGDDTEVLNLSDDGQTVSLEFASVDSFEAKVGDVSRGLISTTIDRTWKTTPVAEAKVFRLVCANGMLSPVRDGSKFRINGKTADSVVERYEESIRKVFQHLTDAVIPGILNLTDHNIEDALALLNSLAAEHALGKRKLSELRGELSMYERANGAIETMYDFWNFLTYQGTHNHELGEDFQLSLQRVAGHLAVSGNDGCPTCSRPIA